MRKVWSPISRFDSSGFSLVEIILALSLFGMALTGLIGGIVYGQTSTMAAGNRDRANLIAEEGIEAVRNIRDASFSNLTDGTYGLVQSGGIWTLSGTSDTNGIYTRQVAISTIDANRKLVSVTVTWNQGASGSGQVQQEARLSWWKNSLTKTWSNAYLRSSRDIAPCVGAAKISVSGNYAYMVCTPASGETANFIVLSISNSVAPSVAATLALPGTANNIYVSGNYAYVASSDDSQELQIINITTPTAPSVAGAYNAVGSEDALGVYVLESLAYITRVNTGSNADYVEVSISNPAAPTLNESLDIGTTAYEVIVFSGPDPWIVTADDSRELIQIGFPLLSLQRRNVANSVDLTGTADAITIAGSDVILVGQGSTFYAVNKPGVLSSASVAGSVSAAGAIQDISQNSGQTLAFLGTSGSSGEFQVVNLNSLTNPAISRTVDVAGSTTVRGVAWHPTFDKVFGASSSTSMEALVFSPN